MPRKVKSSSLRYLADENISVDSIKKLRSFGIDIVGVLELAPAGTIDERALDLANSNDRILITFNKDFESKFSDLIESLRE